jgi:hypothetical protein
MNSQKTVELFDLGNDLHENTNLVRESSVSDVAERLLDLSQKELA